MRYWLFSAICCLALALPQSAAAISCAPPGVSGVSQYIETIPGSSCNHQYPSPHKGTGGGPGGSLPAQTNKALASQGATGKAVQRLVAATGQPSTGGARSQAGGSSALSGSGNNPVSGVLHPILAGSSSGGLGVLLPVLLGVALLLALAAVLLRKRLAGRKTQP